MSLFQRLRKLESNAPDKKQRPTIDYFVEADDTQAERLKKRQEAVRQYEGKQGHEVNSAFFIEMEVHET